MTQARRTARAARRAAYRELVRSVAGLDVFSPTARSIFECLSQARLCEDSALGTELSRQELGWEDPQASVPEELSAVAVAAQLAQAAALYAVAAAKYLRGGDLGQAFRYFRRGATLFAKAEQSPAPNTSAWREAAATCALQAAQVRQEHARRCLCRRRLSLGFWHRPR